MLSEVLSGVTRNFEFHIQNKLIVGGIFHGGFIVWVPGHEASWYGLSDTIEGAMGKLIILFGKEIFG